eukprot:TRINITY_DN1893_c0_g1_i1.p1 TRINITY_DN1893_c0_g1~~TRINITY_DN1893_c0_g1_i1.p1  ORF type:complete len:334 (-),score=123.17 TRINITY_DN1893_c0_g1_i1:1339-2340(-)
MTEDCNTQPCNFCDSTDCNVASDDTHSCDRDSEVCMCSDNWDGVYCEKDITCAGTKLSDGTCCPGLADIDKACCAGALDILDAEAHCCASGELNECGQCLTDENQFSKLIPGTGKCCATGEIDSSFICCETKIDECGVCGGLNECRAKVSSVEEKSISVADCEEYVAAIMDSDSDTYKAEAIATAAVFGIDNSSSIAFDGATCEDLSQNGDRRRLAEFVYSIGLESAIETDGESPSDLADSIADEIETNAPLMVAETSIGGVCGDDQCHLDEVCFAVMKITVVLLIVLLLRHVMLLRSLMMNVVVLVDYVFLVSVNVLLDMLVKLVVNVMLVS